MGHRLRNVAATGKSFFSELSFPRIGDRFGQTGFVAILVRFNFPVIAAGLDKKHRIRTGALLAFHNFFKAELFLVCQKILVSLIDFFVVRHAHAVVIALGLVFHLSTAFVED